ncbi:MAG: L-histidine N(alpha)-methyltransferase [Streptomyces sp.]|uniref:L-histidine N(alpha)-methyltransferase n=1 Tax=Streptomyces sp. TaxID=1931 RepID=UPI003D6C6A15
MPLLEITSFITPEDLEEELRKDVVDGLTGDPKELPPKWFYDNRGSELFEEITRQEEYYPTRRERALLIRHAADIAQAAQSAALLESGAGSGERARILIDSMLATGTLETYQPVDVSVEFLRQSARRMAAEYPELRIAGIAADHDRHLHLITTADRRLTAFLGSTIGNLAPPERGRFLRSLRAIMASGDTLLLGVDLVKEPDRSRPPRPPPAMTRPDRTIRTWTRCGGPAR